MIAAWLALSTAVAAPEPYAVLLGTAQDGGYPQIACQRALCRAARADMTRARKVVSLLVVDPRSGRRWLLDASPDLPTQVEAARDHGGPPDDAPGRPALFDGIFLTHAHIGHYAGLMYLGREAYGSEATLVHATQAMLGFLQANGPWSLLFDAGHLEPSVLQPGEPVALAEDLTVTAFLVPHRPEFSDTVGFVVQGPSRSLLYLPDIDTWDRWERPLEEVLAEVDVALLDATFFDGDELPGRDMAAIPHPFVVTTLERLADDPRTMRSKVHLFHLNHGNPLLDADSEASKRVRRAGLRVASDGDRFGL